MLTEEIKWGVFEKVFINYQSNTKILSFSKVRYNFEEQKLDMKW